MMNTSTWIIIVYFSVNHIVRYIKKPGVSGKMGVQITRGAVRKSKGYLGLMTRTYQPEVDDFVVCYIEKRGGKYTKVHECIIFHIV